MTVTRNEDSTVKEVNRTILRVAPHADGPTEDVKANAIAQPSPVEGTAEIAAKGNTEPLNHEVPLPAILPTNSSIAAEDPGQDDHDEELLETTCLMAAASAISAAIDSLCNAKSVLVATSSMSQDDRSIEYGPKKQPITDKTDCTLPTAVPSLVYNEMENSDASDLLDIASCKAVTSAISAAIESLTDARGGKDVTIPRLSTESSLAEYVTKANGKQEMKDFEVSETAERQEIAKTVLGIREGQAVLVAVECGEDLINSESEADHKQVVPIQVAECYQNCDEDDAKAEEKQAHPSPLLIEQVTNTESCISLKT